MIKVFNLLFFKKFWDIVFVVQNIKFEINGNAMLRPGVEISRF